VVAAVADGAPAAGRFRRVLTADRGYAAAMGYKMLGFVVWHGAQWYVRRRMRNLVPSRRVAAGALVVGGISVAALVAARRGD
jgi:hypothetical protein